MYFVQADNVAELKSLIESEQGVRVVDAADYDGRTALHVAAAEGNIASVQALLDADASVNPHDRW